MGKHGNISKAGKVRKATKKVDKKFPTKRNLRGRAGMRSKMKRRGPTLGQPRAKMNTNK